MAANHSGFVPYCVPVPVSLKDVERELDRQLKATQGPGDSPVVRARMSNLVIYCDSEALGEKVAAEVPAITAVHPARVLLLVHQPTGPVAEVVATAEARAHPSGQGLRAFSELVTLRADGRAGEHLPYAVRSLSVGDLPTNLWWAAPQPPALAGPLLYDLSEDADQVIYDSFGWREPARGIAATASWLARFERGPGEGRYRVASDLTWRRLKPWRRLLGQALDPNAVPGLLDSITEVVIDHGPHTVMSAWSLASWLVQGLNWTVRGTDIRPGEQIDWHLSDPRGARHIQIRRLAESPQGIRQMRIACTIDGRACALVLTPEEDGRRLSIAPEGAAGSPRTVTLPPMEPAELVGRQLSDRERDPVFRQTMAVAQSLAQGVLGA